MMNIKQIYDALRLHNNYDLFQLTGVLLQQSFKAEIPLLSINTFKFGKLFDIWSIMIFAHAFHLQPNTINLQKIHAQTPNAVFCRNLFLHISLFVCRP